MVKNGKAIQVTTFPQFSEFGSVRRGLGFIVQLDLGDAGLGPLVHGELHLQWNMQAGPTSGQAEIAEELSGVKKIRGYRYIPRK